MTRWMLCLAAALAPAAALAQSCDGCGPRLGNSLLGRGGHCGPFGQKIYPLFESRYIKQFCGPHISPESCFGYFKPRITRWGAACPNYPCDDPYAVAQTVTPPTAYAPPLAPPTPRAETAPAETPRSEERPVPVPEGPAPKPPTGGLPTLPGLMSRQTPDMPPVAEPDYGPPPLPLIPTVPVSTGGL